MRVRVDGDKCQGHNRCYAIAPDLLSGMGPKGGGTSDFDANSVRQAIQKLPPDQITADLNALADYVSNLPAANGKLAVAGPTIAMIHAAGLLLPPVAFAIAVAVELGGGLMLILGYQTRGVALALAIFALAAAFSFHTDFADQNQMIHFLKNVMMAGGLLQVVYFGAGPYSVDARRRAKLGDAQR